MRRMVKAPTILEWASVPPAKKDRETGAVIEGNRHVKNPRQVHAGGGCLDRCCGSLEVWPEWAPSGAVAEWRLSVPLGS